ncbi:MAG: aldo/keto reductase [Gemmatimonadetes bacterium]|uniref:Aldo/keto reductase n=1 Tax=Candidatus Kutchimonas denitrificans TaxID=3056748 RepID=A0AAE4Z9C3_9BACT|nr:aldo/keto reductase [Gemmatimonadota bacterium]NIR75042.1 aldo/keto reductase [Candidatus Kutchimonas denitrificans]NIS02862.1 aldo/keto reductase [Gemmatimonadota bacterium]NIT68567.1 aldo/keto reductase [Gemmatimonadota bacterium]NIU52812.1 twin-arginine translocation signal domain-containing protein [Gemmatimonadota bacterium]
MILTRRGMLKLSAGAGAALVLGPVPTFVQGDLIERPIPSTGELVPAVGLGTARTFNAGASESELAPLREVLAVFVEMGGKVLDTAPAYRKSETVSGILAEQLGVTDRLFMATKVAARDRERGIAQMENSFDLLKRDVMDLMQVHNLRGWATLLPLLREWKAAGRIRYIGITTSRSSQYDDFEAVMRQEELDFIQVNYSVGEPLADERILPLAIDRGMAVLVNEPYNRGRLFDAVRGVDLPEWAAEFDADSWGQIFLKWIIGHPAVTCPIPATTQARHARDNMGAAYGRLPDAAMRRRIASFFAGL